MPGLLTILAKLDLCHRIDRKLVQLYLACIVCETQSSMLMTMFLSVLRRFS